MKVLVIGGGGGMGRYTVRTALGFDFVTELVVAGVDRERSTRFVASLGDPRVRTLELDATDATALRRAIEAADVVLNASGPFFRFGVPILKACIQAGRPYCDICDDWEPTLEMLALDDQARQQGITAVVGLGASPGVSNLLAVKAATALDSVDTLVTAWKLSDAVNVDDGFLESGPGPDAAAVHLVHCLAEKIQVVRRGIQQRAPALEHSTIDFPGFGHVDVWSIGHPEAVTLPRRFPGLFTCHNGMLGVGAIVEDLRMLAGRVATGEVSAEEAASLLLADGGREARNARLTSADEQPTMPGLIAFASGLKGGRPARAGAYITRSPDGGMGAITGIPQALFLPLLHTGKLAGPGVLPPEEAIDADEFFALFDQCVGPSGSGLTVNCA